uniref:Annexin n=1 Tax=Hucho hucho TaxID=62062 RepID=A0A4W5KPG0_9TELE
LQGLGTDEETLIEMVCSRSADELVEIKRVYKELFKKELEKDVAGDTSGDFRSLLLALAKRDEPSNIVDYEKIDQDARVRQNAKEKVVTRIVVSRCEVDLMKIRTEFKKLNQKSLYQTIAVISLSL